MELSFRRGKVMYFYITTQTVRGLSTKMLSD